MNRNLLLTLVVILLLAGCSLSKDLSSNTTDQVLKEDLAMKLAHEVQRGKYKLLSVGELHRRLKQKEDIFVVDTMPYDASYKKNHIPGAKHFLFPISEMHEMAKDKQKKFIAFLGADKSRTIVFYCGFVKCSRSHNAAMWAVRLGYNNVYRCPGGIVAWKESAYPVDAIK